MSPSPDAPVIEVTDLVRKFGDRAVINDISFSVHHGETLVIMGGSGCGKSTLLRHIIGSMKPTSGSVKIFGQEITTMDEREIAAVRRRFGMLFQSGALLASLTVGENVALPLLQHTRKLPDEIEDIVEQKLEMVGLSGFEDLKPAGFEAAEVRSGESLHARELKSGAVAHKFTSSEPSASEDKKILRDKATALRKASLVRPIPPPSSSDESDYTGRSRWVYQELRDRKVALFIDKLPEGVWEIRYDFRAEVPGHFHALPVLGSAMYVPEIRCNGAEERLTVAEAEGS